MKCSFRLWNEDGKRWNICATEVAKATSQNPIPRWINPPWMWWGIECLDRKCRTFTTVFISYGGAQVPPLVGHQEGGGLYRIYSPSLQAQVQRWTYSAKTEGSSAHGGKRVGTEPPQSYEVALWLPARKPWRLQRPSMTILRDSTMNVEKGHEPSARVGVDPGAIRETIPGTNLSPHPKPSPHDS